MTVWDVYEFIDEISPFSLQSSWDNSGLCVGSMGREASRIMVALDCTVEVAREAVQNGCGLIVTHHPVIFRGIKKLDLESVVGVLASAGCSVISVHTNFDSAVMNDILCEKLGLEKVSTLALEEGAPFGCVCECEEMTASGLAQKIKSSLGCGALRYNDTGAAIKRVAVCSGSGGSFLSQVIENGCEAFITGDVKHDVFIDANNAGLTVFDAGHFHTENIFCKYMKDRLSQKFKQAEISVAKSNKDILTYL